MFGPKALHKLEDSHTDADPAQSKLSLQRGASAGKQRSSSPTSIASRGGTRTRRASSVEKLLDVFRGRGYSELDDTDARNRDDDSSASSSWGWTRKLSFRSNRRATMYDSESTTTRPSSSEIKSARRIRSQGDVLQSESRQPQIRKASVTPMSPFSRSAPTPAQTPQEVPAPNIMIRERSVHLMALQAEEEEATHPAVRDDTVTEDAHSPRKRPEIERQSSLQKLWSLNENRQPSSAPTQSESTDGSAATSTPELDAATDDGTNTQDTTTEKSIERTVVRVPQNAVPGDRVLARLKTGRQVSFEIPSGAFPGDMLEIRVPLPAM